MKTIKNLKIHSVLLLVILVITGCEKKEPEPALSDQLMGEYTATSYNVSGITVNLPATNAAGVTATARIVSTKVSDNSASFTFVFTQTKSGIATSSNSKMDNVELVKASSGKIESADGLKRVDYGNNKIVVVFSNADPNNPVTVYATKNNI